MKNFFFTFVCILAAAGALPAQTGTPSDFPGYFPEAAEIDASARSFNSSFEGTAGLAKIANGRLVSDVGFVRYERVDYSGASPFSIEVFTLLDSLAAYSLLTLLREGEVQSGPPGDAFADGNSSFLFAHGRLFVRITGKGAAKELLEKTADAVNAKIETFGGEQPRLLEYLPPDGYDASSLRYFVSQDAYRTWTSGKLPDYIDTNYEMEIATARYFTGSHSGTIHLVRFPTPELAEEYYDEFAGSLSTIPDGFSIYARRAGSMVAVLEGNFDHVSAVSLLSAINVSYSLRWIDDAGTGGTIWGIPSVILVTVANSIIFSIVVIVIAILVGSATGYALFTLRRRRAERSTKSIVEEDYDLTWLNLR